MTDQLNH